MNANYRTMAAALTAAILGSTALHAQGYDEVEDKTKNPSDVKIDIEIDGGEGKAEAEVKAGSKLDGNGSISHSESKSVSITSDGKKTIRKTVTTRNGVTAEKTEVLDGDGNVLDESGDEVSGLVLRSRRQIPHCASNSDLVATRAWSFAPSPMTGQWPKQG